MRFISVIAALAAALGTTFDFGLSQDRQTALAPAADWLRPASFDAAFGARLPARPAIERGAAGQAADAYDASRYGSGAPELAMAIE